MSTEIRISDAGPNVDVNRRAPVIGEAEAHIDASAGTVWRVLSEIGRWPEWNSSISRMRLDGPVEVGTSFYWSSGATKIASRLEEIEPPRRIAWSGKTMGIRAVHVYRLEEEGSGTRILTEESFEGLAAWVLRRTLKRTLDKDLADGLAALKAEAERQARAEKPARVQCRDELMSAGRPH